ncbi:substrate-binding periplasmic protein [Acinetobacter sp. c3-l95]|uniref:substrate-binding periplasmic protein n=1 Tax=Acinetobacter sp. c3-l95 TaxID=3342804 RepID=UPI0035B8A407
MFAINYSRSVILLGISLTLVACSKESDDHRTHSNITYALYDKQKYQVAVDAEYAPYSFRDHKNRAVGFDVDILNAIAKNQKLSFEFVFLDLSFDAKSSRKINYDILAGGLYPSDIELMPNVHSYQLSTPYVYGADTIVSRRDDTTKYKSLAMLKDKKVSLLTNTEYVTDIKNIQQNDSNIILRDSVYLNLKDIVQGHANATVGDYGVLRYYINSIQQHSDIKLKTNGKIADYDDAYGLIFPVHTSQIGLKQKINAGLSHIVKMWSIYCNLSEMV